MKDFPFVLFTFMSLHSLLIVLLLTPALRRLRAEKPQSVGIRSLGWTPARCPPGSCVCECAR